MVSVNDMLEKDILLGTSIGSEISSSIIHLSMHDLFLSNIKFLGVMSLVIHGLTGKYDKK